AVYYAVWRIEKARNPKAGWWNSPSPLAIGWSLWLAIAVGMGMFMGFNAAKEIRAADAGLTPQLASAMSIMDVNERDNAVRGVALQAAQGGDAATVRRAIDEIRGSNLHDRTAAEVAVALAENGLGTDAIAVARKIRTNSQRDATLAKLSSIGPKVSANSVSTPSQNR
ncbi:MAG TPA: hypothetical protein DCY13_12110, partial [Verrucomicrobiales bacterium]|nr:hypothetical protein [Verrucomicrobiales bacterium]